MTLNIVSMIDIYEKKILRNYTTWLTSRLSKNKVDMKTKHIAVNISQYMQMLHLCVIYMKL